MKLFKILTLLFITVFLVHCGGGNNATAKLFSIKIDSKGNSFKQNQEIAVRITNTKQKSISKVVYAIDGNVLPQTDTNVTLSTVTLGNKILTATVFYDDTSTTVTHPIKVLAAESPSVYTYEIINTYPHDKNAYTQGLEFYNDTLYESTGLRGESSLRKVDYGTGKVLKQIDLEDSFFGEGITILNDKIYMLTWQKETGFIFDLNTFAEIDRFKYNQSKQGWGLCNNGKQLFKSDGTEKIWLLNTETLAEESYLETVTNTSIFNNANELEYIDGKIYANVYQKESMMIIDATNGAIEGVINFGGLKKLVTQHSKLDVLNGVAYHPERKTLFITGKRWDKLFEVKITKK